MEKREPWRTVGRNVNWYTDTVKNGMEVSQILKIELGFPGGSVVKILPANAEDRGLIPDLGRFHMSWSNWACVPHLLSLCSRAREAQPLRPERLEPVLCKRLLQGSPHTTTREEPRSQLEKSLHSQQ